MKTLISVVFDSVLRILPHRAPTGLFPIGHPDRSSPVLLTGNYTLTVRRVRRALRGRNVWLLIADSKGINVWCAAGGGHLTHHDVIAALRTSGVEERVNHRRVILPQLAATGVERTLVEQATGWNARWGPVSAEDIPAFLDRGGHENRSDRSVRFPLSDRLQMALMWVGPLVPIIFLILWPITGAPAALIDAASVTLIVFGLFIGVPWLSLSTRRRIPVYGMLAVAGFGIGALLLAVFELFSTNTAITLAAAAVIGTGIVSVDLAGSTPVLSSSVNPNDFAVELLADLCTGTAQCVLVCPREVLAMDGHAHKVVIARPADCILCGACIVQCPEDALRFRFADGSVVEPSTVRSTRLNLLGKRTVAVHDESDS